LKVALILSLSKDDPPALAIAPLVVADASLATALTRDDRRDALRPQVGAQPVGIVALVGGQAPDPAGRFGQHNGRGRHVAGVAGRQQQDAGAAEDIGERVDLGRLAAARGSDGLCPRPPLPPWAER
jgi:hypothetical protein